MAGASYRGLCAAERSGHSTTLGLSLLSAGQVAERGRKHIPSRAPPPNTQPAAEVWWLPYLLSTEGFLTLEKGVSNGNGGQPDP